MRARNTERNHRNEWCNTHTYKEIAMDEEWRVQTEKGNAKESGEELLWFVHKYRYVDAHTHTK